MSPRQGEKGENTPFLPNNVYAKRVLTTRDQNRVMTDYIGDTIQLLDVLNMFNNI